jgi:hypothetical protein
MDTFAEIAIVDYGLSFVVLVKQTSDFRFCLRQTKGRLAFLSFHLQKLPFSVSSVLVCSSVTDREMRECMDPEGNGVTMGRGAEGGPGPPGGE